MTVRLPVMASVSMQMSDKGRAVATSTCNPGQRDPCRQWFTRLPASRALLSFSATAHPLAGSVTTPPAAMARRMQGGVHEQRHRHL
jgi:hypothetical protein